MTTAETVVPSEDTNIDELCNVLEIPANISNLATELWLKLRLDNPDDFQVTMVMAQLVVYDLEQRRIQLLRVV